MLRSIATVALCLSVSVDVSLAFNVQPSCLVRPNGGLPALSQRRASASTWAMSLKDEVQAPSRRELLQSAAAALIFTPALANADSTGKFSSKVRSPTASFAQIASKLKPTDSARTAKNRYVPRIKKGIDLVKAAASGGSMDDLLADLEDMVGAMKLYGDAQKRNEVPDKTSLRLVDDAVAFEKGAHP
eukprot:1196129-Rhodomonas_salina.2